MNALREWMREHPLPAALAMCLVVCAALVLSLHAQAAAARKRVMDEQATLDRVRERVEEYRSLQTQAEGNAVLPADAHFDEAAVRKQADERLSACITRTDASAATRFGNLVMRTIVLQMEGVTRQELATFLQKVEALHPAILARELRITTSKRQKKLIDARVTFAAYEAAAVAAR